VNPAVGSPPARRESPIGFQQREASIKPAP
jgi:hypothetical protein